jgi:hypothetical protein
MSPDSTVQPEGRTDARRITVVTAGLSQPSSTRLLADRLAGATVKRLADDGITAEVHVIELRDLAQDITNNLLTGFAAPKLAAAIEQLTASDGAIFVTPIFTTSYSGLFKSFIDVLDPDALTGMPVLLGATGGTERHSLDRRSSGAHRPRGGRAGRAGACRGPFGAGARSVRAARGVQPGRGIRRGVAASPGEGAVRQRIRTRHVAAASDVV